MTKFIIFILLVLVSCTNKKDNFKAELNKFIAEKKEIDTELWEMKLLSSELVEKSENLSEKKRCETLNVVYSIVLKKDCYENKDFLDENLITAQIKKALMKDEKTFKMGNCFTDQDVATNLEKWKTDQMKTVGQKICVSYEHILLGGDCQKEVVVTKEMVESDYNDVKQKAQSSLSSQTVHKKGEQFLESEKVKVCLGEAGPREFSTVAP